jgi:lipoprotein-anchoring transpeptidase ErfK/SrfK
MGHRWFAIAAVVGAFVCAGLGAAPITVADTPNVPGTTPGPGSDPRTGKELPAVLSNESTLSRWAHPAGTAKIRARPSVKARTVGRLHFQTEDKQAEIYLALHSAVDSDGRTWVEIRIPKRPNGRKGWVAREALGPFTVVRTQLVINRTTLRATLFKKGKKIWSAPVGVGRPSLPTPAGRFYVREKLRSLSPFYGPWAIGTSAYSTKLSDWPGGGVVGIHGTNQPELIPGRPSHGCVRVKNKAISRLAHLMPLGSPIRII